MEQNAVRTAGVNFFLGNGQRKPGIHKTISNRQRFAALLPASPENVSPISGPHSLPEAVRSLSFDIGFVCQCLFHWISPLGGGIIAYALYESSKDKRN